MFYTKENLNGILERYLLKVAREYLKDNSFTGNQKANKIYEFLYGNRENLLV